MLHQAIFFLGSVKLTDFIPPNGGFISLCSFTQTSYMIYAYLTDNVEDVLRDEFPESFQELKDTYNPAPSQVTGPTVSVYRYEQDSIWCLRHNVDSDTWSDAYVGHHAWEFVGEVGGSTATSYDDLCEVSVFRDTIPEVLSFMAQGVTDMGDAVFYGVNAPQCVLHPSFHETQVVRETHTLSGFYGGRNPYSVGSILRSTLWSVKAFFSFQEDDWGTYHPISRFFRRIREYSPRYSYGNKYPPLWEFNFSRGGEGDPPLCCMKRPNESLEETLTAYLTR
jgi:hypothetical protein